MPRNVAPWIVRRWRPPWTPQTQRSVAGPSVVGTNSQVGVQRARLPAPLPRLSVFVVIARSGVGQWAKGSPVVLPALERSPVCFPFRSGSPFRPAAEDAPNSSLASLGTDLVTQALQQRHDYGLQFGSELFGMNYDVALPDVANAVRRRSVVYGIRTPSLPGDDVINRSE